MGASRKYPHEIRSGRRGWRSRPGATRRLGQGVDARRSAAADQPRDAAQLGQPAEVDDGHLPGTSSDDTARIAALERESRELCRANQILKNSVSVFRGGEAGPATEVVEQHIDDDRRLHGTIGLVPPVEFETRHYAQMTGPADTEPALETLH